jgi:gliding motility-associated-like protein
MFCYCLLFYPILMKRTLLFLLFVFSGFLSVAQNPATVITTPGHVIQLPCGTTCTTITASVPHIKQSNDYLVQPIPYNAFAFEGGTELSSLYVDDVYTGAITLPFSVCFYGTQYNSLVVGSNGLLSFDVTNAGRRNNFRQTVSFSNLTPVLLPYAAGTQNSLASTYYPKAAIMGVYHDIFPFNNGSRRIEWRIEGLAPKRRFIASFKDISLYGCTSLWATHQIVVYESTGVVEVYVQDKPVCPTWNEGLAILGMQNFDRNKAHYPSERNTAVWGSTGMHEAYRFTPSAGIPRFKKAELVSGGMLVATADTASTGNGQLNLSFPNVCPSADSTQYVLRVTYNSCYAAGEEISFDDTLTVKKANLEIDLQASDPTCTAGGVISVLATGTNSPVQFSINGGQQQESPVFANLSAGDYTITATGSGCTKTKRVTLTLQDDLLLVAQPAVTICAGETFTPQVLSNATSFHWSPGTGISNPADAHPNISSHKNMVYTLTARKGVCEKTAQLDLSVTALPVVNAGYDITIIQGDAVQLNATATGGIYQWTPAMGLSSDAVLMPTAAPTATTTYQLRVLANGCTATDDVVVSVAPYCVNPKEAFSPNGDGINDVWLVTTGSCLQKAKVEVFNRYGGKVYHHEDYKNNWNGTYNGKPLADGTYYYLISYQLINGKMVQAKGNVTILR